jgi:hypothetical protein
MIIWNLFSNYIDLPMYIPSIWAGSGALKHSTQANLEMDSEGADLAYLPRANRGDMGGIERTRRGLIKRGFVCLFYSYCIHSN